MPSWGGKIHKFNYHKPRTLHFSDLSGGSRNLGQKGRAAQCKAWALRLLGNATVSGCLEAVSTVSGCLGFSDHVFLPVAFYNSNQMNYTCSRLLVNLTKKIFEEQGQESRVSGACQLLGQDWMGGSIVLWGGTPQQTWGNLLTREESESGRVCLKPTWEGWRAEQCGWPTPSP